MKFPSITIYTDRIPQGVGGDAHGPVVRVRPMYRNDVGLHQHEWQHVQQWWIVGILAALLLAVVFGPAFVLLAIGANPLLYRFVRHYRLWAEVAAYRAQMQFPNASGVPLTLDGAAKRLSSLRYRLGIDYFGAKVALKYGCLFVD